MNPLEALLAQLLGSAASPAAAAEAPPPPAPEKDQARFEPVPLASAATTEKEPTAPDAPKGFDAEWLKRILMPNMENAGGEPPAPGTTQPFTGNPMTMPPQGQPQLPPPPMPRPRPEDPAALPPNAAPAAEIPPGLAGLDPGLPAQPAAPAPPAGPTAWNDLIKSLSGPRSEEAAKTLGIPNGAWETAGRSLSAGLAKLKNSPFKGEVFANGMGHAMQGGEALEDAHSKSRKEALDQAIKLRGQDITSQYYNGRVANAADGNDVKVLTAEQRADAQKYGADKRAEVGNGRNATADINGQRRADTYDRRTDQQDRASERRTQSYDKRTDAGTTGRTADPLVEDRRNESDFRKASAEARRQAGYDPASPALANNPKKLAEAKARYEELLAPIEQSFMERKKKLEARSQGGQGKQPSVNDTGSKQAPEGVAAPTSRADYDALPSGTDYFNPHTGKVQTKP